MANVLFRKGTQEYINNNVPISDGQVVFNETDQAIYVDTPVNNVITRLRYGGGNLSRSDIDMALSTTSENPVANKVVTNAIGDLPSLQTDVKTNLVGAINEVNAHTDTAQSNINAEATARANADATLQNNIDAEATERANAVTAEATARQTADNTLQGNINSEALTRASADSNLQSQINQIIAPSGEAPSAAEVQNARIGANGVTYDTLGNAIRGQVTDLKSALKTDRLDFTYGWLKANNLTKNGAFYHARFIPCTPGETFIAHNALTDNQYAPAILFYGMDGLFISDVGKNVGGDTLNVTVPTGAYFFGVNKKNENTNCWIEYDETDFKPVEVKLQQSKVDKSRLWVDANLIPGYIGHDHKYFLNSNAYEFFHVFVRINRDFDLVFSNADTTNQWLNYLEFYTKQFAPITEGKRTNTGNTTDTVAKEDFPAEAEYALIQTSASKKAGFTVQNGNAAMDASFLDPYSAVMGILKSTCPQKEAGRWRGWLNHDTDNNFERVIVQLNKNENLVFTGAATSNQYFYYLEFYDANGNALTEGRRKQTGNTTDTVAKEDFPSDAVYACITYDRGHLATSAITNGIITQFAPYNIFAVLQAIANASGGGTAEIQAEIILPSIVTAVVGDTLQMYYDSFVHATGEYEVEIIGTKGHAYPRYFEYTPVAGDIGTSTLTINVRQYENLDSSYANVIATKTITLKTVAVPSSPVSEKHVLMIGDSTIVKGDFVKEVCKRICSANNGDGLTNIKFSGRLQKTVETGLTVGYEGFSGWSWGTYISSASKAIRFYVTGVSSLNFEAVYRDANNCIYNISEINVTGGTGNIRCLYVMGSASTTPPSSGTLTRVSGSGDETITYTSIEVEQWSPFYVNGAVDFENYVNEYCGGSVDYVVFSLGTNSIVGVNAEFSTIKANIISQMTTLIGTLHTQYPSAKVLLCTLQKGSMNGGFGYNFGTAYNANANFYNNKVYQLNKAYLEFASTYSSYVNVVNLSAEFDTKYDFPNTQKPVNVRCTTYTELFDTNFGHPSTIGYNQMADAMYRALYGAL
jgi:hypothetical protein